MYSTVHHANNTGIQINDTDPPGPGSCKKHFVHTSHDTDLYVTVCTADACHDRHLNKSQSAHCPNVSWPFRAHTTEKLCCIS